MLLAAGIFASCSKTPVTPDTSKDPVGPQGETPTVSISADASFSDALKANVTLTLSAAASTDVKVKLAKADIQSGKKEVPADFSKNVTIKAGETSATVEVTADALGLESGDFQAAIKIDSAEGAKVADNATVYINLSFAFKPEVNLYADGQFKSDKTATLKLVLAKATTADVTIKLETDAASTATVSYEQNVTIPAGETEKDVVVTVTIPDGLEAGVYPAIIKIAEANNATVGSASSATINLSYPFQVPITIDGAFDDWNDPSIVTWTLPEKAIFTQLKCMKLAADPKCVYMYLETYEVNNVEGDLTPFDIYINADGNNATGCIIASIDNNAGDPYVNVQQWVNPGIEYYLEGLLNKNTVLEDESVVPGFADLTELQWYLRYNGADGASFWSGFENLNDAFKAHPEKIFAQGVIEGTVGKVEIVFSREAFNIKGTKAAFGVKLMDGFNGWTALGLAPQAEQPNAPTYTAAEELLYIYLPPYAN